MRDEEREQRETPPEPGAGVAAGGTDPVTNTTCTLGNPGDIWLSTNSGATWTNLTSTTYGLGTALTAFAVSSGYATDNTLVAANAGQVYMSTNGGTTWFTPITLDFLQRRANYQGPAT